MERGASSMPVTPKETLLEMGEFKINFATAGDGENIVLLHGGDPRESWRVWEPLLILAERFKLVMPDLIGFGKSSKPMEIPDYRSQARVVVELMERISVERPTLIGTTWGGQVALQIAIEQPQRVKNLVLISSTYDKAQLPRLRNVKRPALILWAEDNMVAQLKAGYVLRDAIGTSRLEVLSPVAKDPRYDFTVANQLERYRSSVVVQKIVEFLEDPESTTREPPPMEPELRGLAMKSEDESDEERGSQT